MEHMMSALPAFRSTAYVPCFAYTGVYYFGPLNVKKGISVVKRWGAIFTYINYTKKTIRSWSLPSSLTVLLMPSEDL